MIKRERSQTMCMVVLYFFQPPVLNGVQVFTELVPNDKIIMDIDMRYKLFDRLMIPNLNIKILPNFNIKILPNLIILCNIVKRTFII